MKLVIDLKIWEPNSSTLDIQSMILLMVIQITKIMKLKMSIDVTGTNPFLAIKEGIFCIMLPPIGNADLDMCMPLHVNIFCTLIGNQ